MLTKLKGVNLIRVQENFSDLIKELRTLNVSEEEIMSDITYTILVCKKDFDKKRGSFFAYLYKSLENNMRRKIYAISIKNATHGEIAYDISTQQKSPLSEALAECPDLFDYAIGERDESGIESRYLDTLIDYF